MKGQQAAFIGLGSMGWPMARNLHRAGLLAAVWNRSPARRSAFAEDTGLAAVDDLAALPARARVLLLCVSADEDVQAVVEALLPGLEEGHVVVDCSTVQPATARQMAEAVAERGASFLDAPVSGGTEGAEAATLSMMVGGSTEALAVARPILEAMASRIIHMGPAGAGQAAKAVNQVAVAGVNQAVSEAMALAASQGLDADRVIEALSGGAADSWFLRKRAPNMRDGVYPLGFRVSLHDKDLAICQALAAEAEAQLPIIEMTRLHYRRLIEAGHGDEDVSALFRIKQAQLDNNGALKGEEDERGKTAGE
ncbi:NAD(P)-dependent oxidoreductase [Natronospira bacteriovora]|uniref:NAD(P)-dependent oxidoreductase n=1 Tax=Natronospira bacteriovora TaxID=3069753 RepID=A0ABU0W7C6_9GAMM|nr:NAD(P)-dependent oxidoreductase [Natronospira sp. AB-CW4]MDQ2069839.1 NAD(P)-dependent oxidoreductase [Natronospira sp. AB-CW4]